MGVTASAGGAETLFEGAFAGRRVFLTGHTGFKGAWLALWLTRLGAEVVGYALEPPSSPSLFQALGPGLRIDDVRGDVRDEGALRRALVAHGPEVVVHLAAQALVLPSYEDPAGTYGTNVMGTVHLLEAVRRCPSVRVVIVVTSDKCYENPEGAGAHAETDPMGGGDPYSSSKGCAELVSRAYGTSFFPADRGVTVATVRAGNVVGGGDWGRDRLLPDCARALAGGEPVTLRHPEAVRPWQYVLEPLAGYLWLAARALAGDRVAGAWNFGPPAHEVASVAQVVERFVRAWGDGEWRRADTAAAPPEAASLRLDSGKAAARLGWHTVCDLDETVTATARWYAAYHRGESQAMRLCLEAIAVYQERAAAAGLPWTPTQTGATHA